MWTVFVLPFALNQSGSVVYVYLLGSADISNAVPICNSLTFVFTAITSRLLGEKPQRPASTYTGMVLILLGVAICFNSKQDLSTSSDEDDGDYVPEAEEEEEDDVEADAVTADKPSVTQSSHVDNLWEDMNASTAVSKTAADKTAKLLGGLTKKTKKTTVDKKKKRKLKEFQMPILSVDVNKSRKDMAGVKKHKVDRVVKFAGKDFIEKQEFLQRLDLKRFEIEKAERDKQRKLQQQQK
uniref:BCNT-C domain-containing protein n=1 Tax=Phytophthora ramorum TaxID=164328 RepID=H3HB45_PHYRM